MIEILQDELKKILEKTFEGLTYKTKSGQKHVQINPQSLKDSSFEDDFEDYPYIVLKVLDGVDSVGGVKPSSVRLLIVIGVYDESLDNQGYRDVLSIMSKIRLELLSRPIISQRFTLIDKLEWTLPDEELNPYYFGGITATWQFNSIPLEMNELV